MSSKILRPDWDIYFMSIAVLVSSRASCARRSVGAVLVNQHNQLLSTGYNGPASGATNCTDKPCAGADLPSGSGLELCEAIHAEANALLQCPDTSKIHTAYCTTAPCIHCTKLLMNTSCRRVVYLNSYPQVEQSKELWDTKWRGTAFKADFDQLQTSINTFLPLSVEYSVNNYRTMVNKLGQG